jgi:hypothetical protein
VTISTRGLTPQVRAALTAHHNAHYRGRVRALDPSDTTTVVRAVREALKKAMADDAHLDLALYGGVVANGYPRRYPPPGDRLTLTLSLASGERTLRVWRGYAPRRAHGLGSCLLVRLRRQDQPNGRIVVNR